LDKAKDLAANQGASLDACRAAIGPLRVDWAFDDLAADYSVIETGHPNYDATRIRTRRYIEEISNALAASQDGKQFANGAEKVSGHTSGGIRPSNLNSYYKAAAGVGVLSLAPWFCSDDSTAKKLFVTVHDDLGQDSDKCIADVIGKAGIYLHLSILGGDGYRFAAGISFGQIPGADFPNREVLGRRYPLAPKAYTPSLRLWRKTSFRGHCAWAAAAEVNGHWPAYADDCAQYYAPAFLHYIHEGSPANAMEFNVNTLVTADQYRQIIQAAIVNAPYSGYPIAFNLDRVWPYCAEPHLGIPRSAVGGTLATFYSAVLDPMFDATWRRYRFDLLYHLVKQVEQQHGRLKGHLMVEFKSSQAINAEEYRCDVCGRTRVEVTTNCAAGQLLTATNCTVAGCAGHMQRYAPPRMRNYNSVPLPAVGGACGGTWLFTTGDGSVWAHEVGHHRHLEHAQSQPGDAAAAPGAKNAQHDAALNPEPSIAADPAKDRAWDRCCIMSYNSVDPLYFCGKCVLKNRGFAVENLPAVAGNLKDV
jgi:hypothetical protein